jgi:NADH-quinone oxidoreductase subunit C
MTLQEIHSLLEQEFGQSILELSLEEFNEFILVEPKDWFEIATFLRNSPELYFNFLNCLTGVDYGPKEDVMEVVYDLFSMDHRHHLTIKVQGPREDFHVPSVEFLWRTADWHEREAYDMFGIIFDGHRQLKRLLLPDDWEGFPLKKDYQVQEYYHGIRVPKIKPKKLTP